MSVLGKEKRHQLRMHAFIVAEVSAEEAADEVSVDRSVISWEMYVFKTAKKAFENSLSIKNKWRGDFITWSMES